MKEFRERTAVVTAAASGIGWAMVAGFFECWCGRRPADIDEERL